MASALDELAATLRKNALAQVSQTVNRNLPAGLRLQVGNPAPANGGRDDDDDDDDDDGDDDEVISLAFEDADREHNLECAVAAWRVAGDPDAIVAQHKSGTAFFGDEDDLAEYCETHDLAEKDWKLYSDADELMGMDYDLDACKRVIKLLDSTEYDSAQAVYEGFHWGDPSNITVVKNVTGVSAPLVHLGVGRRIEYGAKKNGEFAEYYHEFGETSGKFPQVYAILDPEQKHPVALLVHGGEMRIEPRGIVE